MVCSTWPYGHELIGGPAAFSFRYRLVAWHFGIDLRCKCNRFVPSVVMI